MSRIFDALQRSERERSGTDVSAFSTATELLQFVERQVATECEAGTLTDRSERAESMDDVSLPMQQEAPEIADLIPSEIPSLAEPLGPFGQFQSLHIEVPSQNRLICLTANESLAAEKFRFLGVRLQHLRRHRQLKTVLITSSIPQEGKSTVAANLACTLARVTQQRILLLDGDLRRPSIAKMFGLGNIPGICEWLQTERSLAASIYYLEEPGLWVLPAGRASNTPLELLQSEKLSALMDQLNAWFDWVIIDSPPLLTLADASVWTRLAEGILLVTRKGVTEKQQLQKALEMLEQKKLIGALLNCSQRPYDKEYYSYYGTSAAS
jgi:capsular exopolysaccharide synthesis family protein